MSDMQVDRHSPSINASATSGLAEKVGTTRVDSPKLGVSHTNGFGATGSVTRPEANNSGGPERGDVIEAVRPRAFSPPRTIGPTLAAAAAYTPINQASNIQTTHYLAGPQYPPMPSQLSNEKRFTPTEKGKGKAPEAPYVNGQQPLNRSTPSKVEIKKRVPTPAKVNGEGESQNKDKAKSTTPVPSAINPAAAGLPLSHADKAFADRMEVNRNKTPLGNMKGPCPVWSNTRKGLQSALEYLRNPTKTGGASVDISPGGMARGLILEGQSPSDVTYWGNGVNAGTLMLPIGKPRLRRKANAEVEIPDNKSDHSSTALGPDETFVEPLPLGSASLLSTEIEQQHATPNRSLEAPEIEALLMSHRARIPVAIAVAQDYSGLPFRLPRPFVVLGWFWIVDAWVEPVATSRDRPNMPPVIEVDEERVVWKFRFEFCPDHESTNTPWWQSRNEPSPPPLPVSATSTVEKPQWRLSPGSRAFVSYIPADQSTNLDNERDIYKCPKCSGVSARPYANIAWCLNEECEGWSDALNQMKRGVDGLEKPYPPKQRERITPQSLRMTLRPPEPDSLDNRTISQVNNAGREYWTGWVCHTCGCASERKKWHGWNCEACKRTLYPKHVYYSAPSLRGPLRPVSTGPRPDDGLASWPFEASHAWTLFEDDIKVVRHGVEAGFGKGTVIYHSLNHEGPALLHRRVNANNLFMELQRTQILPNGRELAYRRHVVNPKTPRMCERYLSPFYTLLLGPEPVPLIESLPADRPTPWREADQTLLDLADLINERAGQIFPGEPERFNSLLVAVSPPGLSASQAPRVYIPAHSFMSFTFLGSDGTLKVRRPAGTGTTRGKQGQMTLQHGDVVGVQTGPDGLEVIVQQDTFGIFCIGRQIYQLENDPIEHIIAYHDTVSRPRKVPNKPPPRPTKLPHVPLTYWYIGPYPLDPERPMKVQPALQILPSDIQMPIRPKDSDIETAPDPEPGLEKTYTGTEVITDAITPTVHNPPHIPGEKNWRKRKTVDPSESTEGEKTKVKAKPRKSAGKDKAVGEDEKGESGSPVKKKGRKSGGVSK